MPNRRRPFEERFFSKIRQDGDCWVWTGGTVTGGYGMFWDSELKKGVKAHRAAYRHFKGPIPDGLCVCHSCDNPPCVNPAHLRVDTAGGNSLEAYQKRRRTSPKAKLTAQAVKHIRAQAPAGYGSRIALAKKFGVDRHTIYRVISGKFHKGVV